MFENFDIFMFPHEQRCIVCVCVYVCVMQDSKWVEEKQNLIRINQELREKVFPLLTGTYVFLSNTCNRTVYFLCYCVCMCACACVRACEIDRVTGAVRAAFAFRSERCTRPK